ncbi:glutathione S-transferase zeta class-like [Eucalyptus grandis]|uniref:glutathione S-transferase zeta class-like n=1 Tax=Eucalyptus grandis TaxID=71139 RepID=UPI00192F0D40|nr:glutathione S-transferase zeta class-like [Eucalyptus grandis]
MLSLQSERISYEYKAVDLRKEKQYTAEFDKLNPMHLVPVLVDGDFVVSDSYAILLAASIISSSIQPLQMLTVLAKFPTLRRIHESYKTLPEYEASSPNVNPMP